MHKNGAKNVRQSFFFISRFLIFVMNLEMWDQDFREIMSVKCVVFVLDDQIIIHFFFYLLLYNKTFSILVENYWSFL